MQPAVAEWYRVWNLLQAARVNRGLTEPEQQLEQALRITLRMYGLSEFQGDS